MEAKAAPPRGESRGGGDDGDRDDDADGRGAMGGDASDREKLNFFFFFLSAPCIQTAKGNEQKVSRYRIYA